MATIEDRWKNDREGTGKRWRVRWRDPQRQWRSKSFERRADAERWMHKLQADLDAGQYTDPTRGRLAFADMADTWWAAHQPLLKASTATAYRGLLDGVVLPRWGRTPLVAITHSDLAAWIGQLRSDGVSASRVRHAHGLIAQVLDLAVADRRLTANAARGVKLPPLPMREQHRYLTHAELLRLAFVAGHHRRLILVLGYCGLRWGEAVALRKRDFDPTTRRLSVQRTYSEVGGRLTEDTPKNHKRRQVPVPAFVADMLDSTGDPDGLLLPAPKGGVYRNSNFRTGAWPRLLDAANLEPLRIHDLRHTAASLAISAGANVLAVSRMLGHQDPSITLRVYADLFDTDLDEVAAKLDAHARAVQPVSDAAPIRLPNRA